MFPSIKSNICALVIIVCLTINGTYQEDSLQCGVPKITKKYTIVNGYDTEPGAWPWHVAVYHRNGPSNKYVCGGTLISKLIVLTAAHCVLNTENRQHLSEKLIFVRLGLHNIQTVNSLTLRQHEIHKIYTPENFTGLDFRNDIAILELSTKAIFNAYVQPACVSTTDDLTGQYGTVIGWGATEKKVISPVLKSAKLPVIDSMTCLASNRPVFGATLDNGIFCAGYLNGTSTCTGDSGGGIFFQVDKKWHLGGIVSYSPMREDGSSLCETKSYGAFTNVHMYLPWISNMTKLVFNRDDDGATLEGLDGPSFEAKRKLLPQAPECGRTNYNPTIGGEPSGIIKPPWIARIQHVKRRNNQTAFHCMGSLINQRYVLTAAHCLSGIPFGWTVTVVCLGEMDTVSKAGQCISIEKVIVHEHFTNSRREVHNDIALLRLASPVRFSETVKPICLPLDNSFTNRPLDDAKLFVSRWLKTDPNRPSKTHVLVPKVSMQDCRSEYPSVNINDRQICAGGDAGHDSCRGNSGGPLTEMVLPKTRESQPTFYIMGVENFGGHCGSANASLIYTNVNRFGAWILNHIEP